MEPAEKDATAAVETDNAELSYADSIEKWRTERAERLMADDGWLTVDGLFFLKEGANRFGSGADNEIVLPEGAAPDYAGRFDYVGRAVSVTVADGVQASFQGEPLSTTALELGEDHAITLGELKLWVHYSGERWAIRIRNPESELRKNFEGLSWYPVDEKYRVEAKLVPYDEPRPVEVLNILGDIEKYTSPGELQFSLNGEQMSLQAFDTKRGGFFLVVSDGTSGETTYPSARFLATDAPVDGVVTLDFNKAYNPPCALNPHTTCPLPPPENEMTVSLEAGEKYKGHHDTTDD